MSEGPRDQNDDRWQGLSQAAQHQPGSRGNQRYNRPQEGEADRGQRGGGGHGGYRGGRGRHADPARGDPPEGRRNEERQGDRRDGPREGREPQYDRRDAPRDGRDRQGDRRDGPRDGRDQHYNDRPPRGGYRAHNDGDPAEAPHNDDHRDRADRSRGRRPQRDWRDDGPREPPQDFQAGRPEPHPRGPPEGEPNDPQGKPRYEGRGGRGQRRYNDDDRVRSQQPDLAPAPQDYEGRVRGDEEEGRRAGGPPPRDRDRDHRDGGRGNRMEYGGRGRGRGREQQWSRDVDYDRAQYSKDVFTQEGTAEAPTSVEAPPRRTPPAVTRERPSREPVHEGPDVEALFKTHHKQTGIDFDVYDTIEVDIVPKSVPPVQSFDDLHIHPLLQANFDRSGYKKPTPVQRYGIPVTLAGKDLMACAQTGSGKTVAFLTPIMQHILVNGVSLTRSRVAFPIAVIMAPTRELALQIFDEARKCCYKTDVATVVIYGGAGYSEQIAHLDYACDIVVATPGRLKDLFDKGRIAFERVKFLVLDEADRMLELGFEEQVEELVCGRHSDMPPVEERQTMMYSATFPRPIQNLARRYMKPASFLLTVGRVGSTTKNITQRVLKVDDAEKQAMVLRLLYVQSQSDLVLIFMQTKHEADELCDFLLKHDIPCSAIHGDRQQWQREAALSAFKRGETPILVATDVASRGLDIPNVAHVIQYDLPNTLEDYVHRIGRTGRAGNKGCATCFFNRKNEGLRHELIRYLKDHDQDVPDWMEAAQLASHVALSADYNRRGGHRDRRGDRDREHSAPTASAPSGKAEGEEELADDWETLAGINTGGRNDRRGGSRGGRGRSGPSNDGRGSKSKAVFNDHDGGF